MVFDGSLLFFVVLDGSFGFLVVLGGSCGFWWFMVVQQEPQRTIKKQNYTEVLGCFFHS